ncbi:MAG: hypothetical protein B7C24_00790 [Bacteroidetes bacterium 4572_77]|nr:MAG: hypothetical protein B7C24_00790 [Bacteroidetes bacterium 4572_77]
MHRKNTFLKFFLLVLVVFGLNTHIRAQQFTGGIMAGLVGSQVAGDPSSGYNKLGFYSGAFTHRQFTLKSGAQLEIYYIQKGARENPTKENGQVQYLMRIQYIEIPLLYTYTINPKLDLQTGLAFSYFIGTAYEEYNFNQSVPNTPFHKASATFILGIDYKINDNLSANFRTNNSITPIRDHASGQKRFFNRGQYSDALCFGLVYTFSGRKE